MDFLTTTGGAGERRATNGNRRPRPAQAAASADKPAV